MSNRTRTLAAGAATVLAATLIPAAPAMAADCSGPFCAVIRHASPDRGFDAPFTVRCDPHRGRDFNIRLNEGEVSTATARCTDVSHVILSPHTQLHCDQRGNPFDSRRVMWSNDSDNRVRVAVGNNWSWDCTNQRT